MSKYTFSYDPEERGVISSMCISHGDRFLGELSVDYEQSGATKDGKYLHSLDLVMCYEEVYHPHKLALDLFEDLKSRGITDISDIVISTGLEGDNGYPEKMLEWFLSDEDISDSPTDWLVVSYEFEGDIETGPAPIEGYVLFTSEKDHKIDPANTTYVRSFSVFDEDFLVLTGSYVYRSGIDFTIDIHHTDPFKSVQALYYLFGELYKVNKNAEIWVQFDRRRKYPKALINCDLIDYPRYATLYHHATAFSVHDDVCLVANAFDRVKSTVLDWLEQHRPGTFVRNNRFNRVFENTLLGSGIASRGIGNWQHSELAVSICDYMCSQDAEYRKYGRAIPYVLADVVCSPSSPWPGTGVSASIKIPYTIPVPNALLNELAHDLGITDSSVCWLTVDSCFPDLDKFYMPDYVSGMETEVVFRVDYSQELLEWTGIMNVGEHMPPRSEEVVYGISDDDQDIVFIHDEHVSMHETYVGDDLFYLRMFISGTADICVAQPMITANSGKMDPELLLKCYLWQMCLQKEHDYAGASAFEFRFSVEDNRKLIQSFLDIVPHKFIKDIYVRRFFIQNT